MVKEMTHKENIMDNNVVTCAYCGHQYPDGTPTAKAEALTEHIKVCSLHPMQEEKKKVDMLRSALAGLIGVDSIEDLDNMKFAIISTPAPDSDKAVMINAIDALRATR